ALQASLTEATRLMAAVPAVDPAKQMGQVELFRTMALGSFYDLLVAVARDPAMLYWLDGRLNFKSAPQENFGREVMELFTMGVVNAAGQPNYTESDVKAAARVFTGWNLQDTEVTTISVGDYGSNRSYALSQYAFYYDARSHDLLGKTFSFPVYP